MPLPTHLWLLENNTCLCLESNVFSTTFWRLFRQRRLNSCVTFSPYTLTFLGAPNLAFPLLSDMIWSNLICGWFNKMRYPSNITQWSSSTVGSPQHLLACSRRFCFPGLLHWGRLWIAPLQDPYLEALPTHAKPYEFLDTIRYLFSVPLAA